MTFAELKDEAVRRGFTHVYTAAGLVLLTDWQPYGNGQPLLTWDVNVPDRAYDMSPHGTVAGVWRFVRCADADTQELAAIRSAFGPVADWYENGTLAERIAAAVEDLQTDRRELLKLKAEKP